MIETINDDYTGVQYSCQKENVDLYLLIWKNAVYKIE